jgi:hydrogenase expression/formation protein HypE
MNQPLPLGKLPHGLLAQLLAQSPNDDPRIILGPGVGLDCAVLDTGGPNLLVYKSDPITFASDEIGWYLVQVSSNDIATTGALPRWLLVTLLLPEGKTTAALVERISDQIHAACQVMDISVIGGHSEITYGLDRPIVIGTLIGEVARDRLVTPQGAQPGDLLLLSKGVPIEATAILAREFPDQLRPLLTPAELAQAQAFLTDPGIGVLRDAQIALAAGRVTAMHDPTEGGLAAALWELAQASGRCLTFEPAAVPVPPLARRICEAFQLDPLATIASGALLLAAPAADAEDICQALERAHIPCAVIGRVEAGPAGVWQQTSGGRHPLAWPERDEITRVYETE